MMRVLASVGVLSVITMIVLTGCRGGRSTASSAEERVAREEARADARLLPADGGHQAALAAAPRVTVTGRVIALDDKSPVAGFRVWIVPLKGDHVIVFGADRQGSITDADGRFTIPDAPSGHALLQVYPEGESQFGGTRVERTIRDDRSQADVGDIEVVRRTDRNLGSDLGFDLDTQGLEVARVRRNGPAAHSGLVVGDVIVSIDGADVTGARAYLAGALLHVPVGTKVTLGVARGETLTITTAPKR